MRLLRFYFISLYYKLVWSFTNIGDVTVVQDTFLFHATILNLGLAMASFVSETFIKNASLYCGTLPLENSMSCIFVQSLIVMCGVSLLKQKE